MANILLKAVTGLLAKEKNIFPHLHHLLVNKTTQRHPAFGKLSSECLDIQMVQLKDAVLARPLLCLAVCGPVRWTCSECKKWTTTYNGQSSSTIDHSDAETPNGHLVIKYEV